jgi:hypothetical protein
MLWRAWEKDFVIMRRTIKKKDGKVREKRRVSGGLSTVMGTA